ncbi:ADP-ribose pyrophosphatase YjhB, NUDIX family [Halogranum amylolyticum]|uniref:ADP-ribose pyrophosphatase YjhB, NUDIX family n=1 Tax=Halogranum amylolyticum TaxID=660520 RepID=A0A1H8S424_9EURY|nr:NUDIX hydrolase [Halogranum amylolyticum]SEO72913.1 ADP-ribose pyrophosphatase YjhB, NUDIX family [Halogranum amylolyticum]
MLRTRASDHAASLVADVEDRWGPIPDEGSFVVPPLPDHDVAFPTSLRAFHEEFYPHAAGCVTRDGDGRMLAIRSTSRGNWETPGGAGEPDETPAETARREVREETGVVPRLAEPLYRLTMEVDFGYDETLPIPVVVFVGEPADGRVLDADAVETPTEVADVDWVDLTALPESFRDRRLLRKHLIESG